jgi:hypothetical protein
MKKQNHIARMLQWLVVLAALAVAATQFSFVTGAAYWLVTIGIGLSCIGFADAVSSLIKKEEPAIA